MPNYRLQLPWSKNLRFSGVCQDGGVRARSVRGAHVARVREVSRADGHSVGAGTDDGRPQDDGRAAESRGEEVEHEL